MDIKDLRSEIDDINTQLVELYKKRMEVSEKIADYKKENGLPVFDPVRERELLLKVSEQAGEDHEQGVRVLFSMLMELSRSYQNRRIASESPLATELKNALENTPELFPEKAVVACQGTEGANSQAAAEKLFSFPNIMYFNSFESIFSAVESGLCRYGILPLENSTAGSVRQVYDLMIKKKFSIVRSVRVQINHVLLAKPGVKPEEITEIISHEQAIAQCSDYIKQKGYTVTECENTATASKLVAQSDKRNVAAIASRSCAELYGLNVVDSGIQNNANNYTRFICISKQLEIYPGADRTSMMMVTSHKPGSLYRVLSRFFALGVNLIKLESRPIPGRDFEFRFYFDIAQSVYSPTLTQLICELENELEEFSYLGSYSEVV
ncbi:MAG: chorismate mutase [Clostridia bacterium]|nr:chorismate mutase [Clostridia bacterium]